MKRILAVLLCLAMMFTIAACKPDNITYPAEITDPDAGQEQKPIAPADTENTESGNDATPDPEEAPSAEGEKESAAESADAAADGDAAQSTAESAEDAAKAASANPLAAKGYTPATGTASTLPASGIVKNGAAVSVLKNRTIVIYTADDQPAFSYTDENGQTITEWEWMARTAAENGFIMKYSVKSSAVSLKSQRVALFAGKKLSLVQLGAGELGSGLTLSQSAAEFLDTAVSSFGISKTVLNQSGSRLLAPVGNVNALWYNSALTAANTDPQALSKANNWTVEQFKVLYNSAAEKKIQPLAMAETLAWATLSGKSPLTLLDGKLDSNIHARATREVWTALRDVYAGLTAFEQENAADDAAYSLQAGTTAMAYTAVPAAGKDITLKYAPLPSLEKGTAGTVTFTGTFFALPKYEKDDAAARAALQFAELWCNRYTETLAASLQALGISGSAYQEYCDFAEAAGYLILHSADIEETVKTYLSGLTDAKVDMETAYAAVADRVNALITAKNLYY